MQAALLWRYPARGRGIRAARLAYDRPATNGDRSDYVSVPSVGTLRTQEVRLRFPVCFRAMPAGRTRPGRIARINKLDRHTAQARFVAHELLQLVKRPRLQDRTLRLPSPHPRLNVLQIFERNLTLRALSRRYELFGDHMVGVRQRFVI
jgi:hypothetical protein